MSCKILTLSDAFSRRKSQWPIENKLQMQPSKSNFMFNGSSYLNDKNIEQPVTIKNTAVSRISTHACLGVQMKNLVGNVKLK